MAEALSRHADEILRAMRRQGTGRRTGVPRALGTRPRRPGDSSRVALRQAPRGDRRRRGRPARGPRPIPRADLFLPRAPAVGRADARRRTIASTSATRRCCAAGRSWRASGTLEAATGRPPEGWLAEERTTASAIARSCRCSDGDAGGEKATLNDPERTKRWWDSLPRTPPGRNATAAASTPSRS